MIYRLQRMFPSATARYTARRAQRARSMRTKVAER